MTNLIIDVSNIVWATRYAEFKGQREAEFTKELLTHSVIQNLISLHIKFKTDGILLACDGDNTWRKAIYPAYKATREKDMFFEEVCEVLQILQTFFSENTDTTCVKVEGAEADDVIYVATQLSSQSVIVSSDKDFIQLLSNKTRLYASTMNLERLSIDPKYDLFLKCIRGDTGDNIRSAYPRIRETKLKEAYEDVTRVKMMNLMETILPDGKKVGDNYEFNRRLIDLTFCPLETQHKIKTKIEEQVSQNISVTQLQLLKALVDIKCPHLAREVGKSAGFYNRKFVLQMKDSSHE